jgi:hypothetical protein
MKPMKTSPMTRKYRPPHPEVFCYERAGIDAKKTLRAPVLEKLETTRRNEAEFQNWANSDSDGSNDLPLDSDSDPVSSDDQEKKIFKIQK